MNKFKIEMMKLLKKSGRKKGWLSDKMKMKRITFFRKANADTFTAEQKQKIKDILK